MEEQVDVSCSAARKREQHRAAFQFSLIYISAAASGHRLHSITEKTPVIKGWAHAWRSVTVSQWSVSQLFLNKSFIFFRLLFHVSRLLFFCFLIVFLPGARKTMENSWANRYQLPVHLNMAIRNIISSHWFNFASAGQTGGLWLAECKVQNKNFQRWKQKSKNGKMNPGTRTDVSMKAERQAGLNIHTDQTQAIVIQQTGGKH